MIRACESYERSRMEAAGIEPASRDISMMASTCVVDYLGFARSTVNRQTENRTRRERNLTANVLEMFCSDLELVTRFQGSPAKPIIRSYAFCYAARAKLLLASKVCDQIFTWPSDQPRHATSASTYPVESNSPPNDVTLVMPASKVKNTR